jgi:hypothetical protein
VGSRSSGLRSAISSAFAIAWRVAHTLAQIRFWTTSCLPTNQKLSRRDPHRKASQPAVALMLYTQQAASVEPKFYLQSAK